EGKAEAEAEAKAEAEGKEQRAVRRVVVGSRQEVFRYPIPKSSIQKGVSSIQNGSVQISVSFLSQCLLILSFLLGVPWRP
ncbi:MAG TPA: hypothetical protein VK872_04725, partial [Draconibacterium sp.]|nr:hypothetical protein [Draconibacterium sp.]